MPRNSDTFWSRVLFKDFIRHFRKMSPEQIAEDITESMDALDDLNPDGDSFGSLMVRWANERMNGAFATAARENGKKGGRPKKETTADGDTREDSLNESDGRNSGDLESGTSANLYGDASTREGEEDCTCRESGRSTPTTVSKNMRRVPQNEAPAHGFSGGRTAQGTMSRSPEAAAQSGKDSTLDSRTDKDGQPNRRTVAPSTGAKSSTATVRSMPLPTTEQLYDFVRAENLDEADAREWYEMTVVERAGKDRDGKPIRNWKGALKRFCTTKTANRRSA